MLKTRNEHTIAPLGSYLAGIRAGSATAIEKALASQHELADRGVYKPLGAILLENGDVSGAELDACLRRLWKDVLRQVDLFQSLSDESLAELAAVAENVIRPGGEIVYRCSSREDRYFVVASGSVRVFQKSGGQPDITFAVLGPGEGFGELALLSDEPRSASVETMERTSLIVLPRQAFLKAVFAEPAAARTCARILAERLSRDNIHLLEASSAGLAYRQFITDQLLRDEPLLIGNSPVVMKLMAEIEAIAGNNQPVLVTGEPGSEMRDAAGLIHLMGPNAGGLIMVMDAKATDLADAHIVDANDPVAIELIQAATLFGCGFDALPFAPDKRVGLLVMARDGMVVIENVEQLAPRVQDRLADYLERNWFHAVGELAMIPSNARIAATSTEDLAALAAIGKFDRRLYGFLSGWKLALPPLRRRKQDIRIIVDELIKRNNRKTGKNITGIDDEAYQAIMGYGWPGNTEELSVVIRRAVSLAHGNVLMLEDIFLTPPAVTGKFTLNLLQYGPVQRFFKSGWYPRAGMLVAAPFIALLIGLGLFGTQDPRSNVALILVWGLWEPVLMTSALFASRAWCSICPVGAFSGLVRRTIGLHAKAPLFIRNYGFYFSAFGVAVIIGAASASGMHHSPRATAFLILTIVTLAGISGFLFQRSAWCRYLCPLGSIVGTLSACSLFELRANYGICNTTCKDHDCYTGGQGSEGCPMFEGPFSLTTNRNCVLCGTCIKVCPHQSPVLNLRLPGYELWTAHVPEKGIAAVGTALLGTQLFRGMEQTGVFSAAVTSTWPGSLSLVAASVLAAFLYIMFAERTVFADGGRDDRAGKYGRMVYALLPLVFGFEAAYQLGHLLALAGQILPVLGRQTGIATGLPGVSASLQTIKFVQAVIVFVGAIGSLLVVRLTLGKQYQLNPQQRRRLWHPWPVLVLALVYLWMFLGVAG